MHHSFLNKTYKKYYSHTRVCLAYLLRIIFSLFKIFVRAFPFDINENSWARKKKAANNLRLCNFSTMALHFHKYAIFLRYRFLRLTFYFVFFNGFAKSKNQHTRLAMQIIAFRISDPVDCGGKMQKNCN